MLLVSRGRAAPRPCLRAHPCIGPCPRPEVHNAASFPVTQKALTVMSTRVADAAQHLSMNYDAFSVLHQPHHAGHADVIRWRSAPADRDQSGPQCVRQSRSSSKRNQSLGDVQPRPRQSLGLTHCTGKQPLRQDLRTAGQRHTGANPLRNLSPNGLAPPQFRVASCR